MKNEDDRLSLKHVEKQPETRYNYQKGGRIMKHGIYYAYWEHEWAADYVPYIDKAADLGFDILEIGCAPLPEYTPEQIRRLKAHAAERNIILTGGYGPVAAHNIGHRDPAVVKGALDWYARLFEKMGQLDMHLLCGGLYSYWPYDFSDADPKEEEWKRSVEGMQKLADLAAPYQINLCCEVLNRFEGYLLNVADEGIRYVQDVGKENVRLHLDTFHMNIEEDDMAKAIRRAGRLLGHVHTGEANRRVPGQGTRIPWKAIGEALREIGYDGAVVMEPFVLPGGQVGSDIKIWHDLSNGASPEDLDRDAAAAVIFQRNILDSSPV